MFYNFTPFSFLFVTVYSLLLFCLSSLQDFFSVWILIELMMLVFLGISYSLLSFSFSSVMQYFLVQTLASFSLFIFYFLGMPVLYTLSFILNLAMFPFFSWFISIVPRFPSILFYLSTTFHNLPPFYLMFITVNLLSVNLLIFSSVLSLLVSGLIMLVLSDFRFLIIVSSVGNNSWFILSLLQGLHVFLGFFIIYTLTLLFVLSFLRSSSTILATANPLFFLSVLALSGLPPFPLFFAKAYLIFLSFSLSFILLLLLVFAALSLTAYVRSLFSFITFHFSVQPLFFL